MAATNAVKEAMKKTSRSVGKKKAKGHKKKGQSGGRSFLTYLTRVFRQTRAGVSPSVDIGISSAAMSIADQYVQLLEKRIKEKAFAAAAFQNKNTVTAKHIQAGTRCVLSGQLLALAQNHGVMAVTNFTSHD